MPRQRFKICHLARVYVRLLLLLLGAFNITLAAQRRSMAAEQQVRDAMGVVADSEYTRQRVRDILNARRADYDRQYAENEDDLDDIETDFADMKDRIQGLNNMVSARACMPRSISHSVTLLLTT